MSDNRQKPRLYPPKKQMIEALRAARGNVTRAAEALGCRRETYYTRFTPAEIQQIKQDADTWRVDIALLQFDKALLEGERWAVERVLTSKGGFGDQTSQTVTIVKIIEGIDEGKL